MLIPNTTMIGGLPFTMANRDTHLAAKRWANETELSNLTLSVNSCYSNERSIGFYFNMVADWFLHFAGWKAEDAKKFKFHLGGALHFLCVYNRLDWVIDPQKSVPAQFNINGVYYTIDWDDEEGLKARDALGECEYMELKLRIMPGMKWALRNWVIIHELTHAILYEANYEGDENDESVVITLGTLIYNFLKDNPEIVNYPHYAPGGVDNLTKYAAAPDLRCRCTPQPLFPNNRLSYHDYPGEGDTCETTKEDIGSMQSPTTEVVGVIGSAPAGYHTTEYQDDEFVKENIKPGLLRNEPQNVGTIDPAEVVEALDAGIATIEHHYVIPGKLRIILSEENLRAIEKQRQAKRRVIDPKAAVGIVGRMFQMSKENVEDMQKEEGGTK